MAYELVYTSVPNGLQPGSSGFCIVAHTNGLAANLARQLEALSAYKAYFPHYDANATKNPVSFAHYRWQANGNTYDILSRVCFYGQDYSKRSNKLAHHLVLSSKEISSISSGPTAVFQQKGLFRTEWNLPPQLFPEQVVIQPPEQNLQPARTWEQYAGDAGWAGVLANGYLTNPSRPAYIIFDPLRHLNLLALVQEALMLLPVNQRWQLSFNTYFNLLPAGMECAWRFVTPDAKNLKELRHSPGNLIIDLTQPLPAPPENRLTQAARSGKLAPEEIIQQPDSLHIQRGTRIEHHPIPTFDIKSENQKHQQKSIPWGFAIGGGILVVILAVLLFVFLQTFTAPPPIDDSSDSWTPPTSTQSIAEGEKSSVPATESTASSDSQNLANTPAMLTSVPAVSPSISGELPPLTTAEENDDTERLPPNDITIEFPQPPETL